LMDKASSSPNLTLNRWQRSYDDGSGLGVSSYFPCAGEETAPVNWAWL
jgi:hypothetical protein